MKKICYIFLMIGLFLSITGCKKIEENISGNLSDLMKELYVGIDKEEVPMLTETKVTNENETYYLGTTDLKYKEALASEPAMSSIAHSVVLIRMESVKDVESAKKEILSKVNPRKWVCVEVEEENVIVESKGDLIVLIMDNQYASIIKDNFNKLESNQ